MGSKVLVLYSLSLVLAIIRLQLSPFLVTCSSISSPSLSNNNSSSISSVRCHPEESSALLGFKNSMTIVNSNPYINIRSWKKGTDCCGWDGVTCHPTSHHVVDLYLLSSGLLGALDSNNTLFQLRHLRSLSLSNNDFSQSPISPMFGSSFPHLEELDLSYSNFSGEVPVEISQLSNLQVLSLLPDSNGGGLVITMKMSTFYNIISNMTKLSDLFLGGVNIDSTIPPSLANLSSLEVLNLGECNLRGQLPANVLNFPLLKEIYLGGNQGISANFQLSNWSTSLERIDLSNVISPQNYHNLPLCNPSLICCI